MPVDFPGASGATRLLDSTNRVGKEEAGSSGSATYLLTGAELADVVASLLDADVASGIPWWVVAVEFVVGETV